MPQRQIDDVDVIAQPGAVVRGVVAAPNVQALALAAGDLRHIRQQIARHALGVFANVAAGVRADWVEVAQDGNAPRRVGRVHVAQQVLGHPLGAGIGVAGVQRVLLGQRQRLRLAVHRGRRAEYQRAHAGARHRFQQAQRADDVVVVVAQRLFQRLAHHLERGKVHHGDCATVGQRVVERFGIADIAPVGAQALAGQRLNAAQHVGRAVAEVIKYRNGVTGLEQLHTGVATDVTGTAGHQNSLVFNG